ncbi:hypothetical protein ACJX0J_013268 [Zea mays]
MHDQFNINHVILEKWLKRKLSVATPRDTITIKKKSAAIIILTQFQKNLTSNMGPTHGSTYIFEHDVLLLIILPFLFLSKNLLIFRLLFLPSKHDIESTIMTRIFHGWAGIHYSMQFLKNRLKQGWCIIFSKLCEWTANGCTTWIDALKNILKTRKEVSFRILFINNNSTPLHGEIETTTQLRTMLSIVENPKENDALAQMRTKNWMFARFYLWSKGVRMWDGHKKYDFDLRAFVLLIKRYIGILYLHHCREVVYMGHRRFLASIEMHNNLVFQMPLVPDAHYMLGTRTCT